VLDVAVRASNRAKLEMISRLSPLRNRVHRQHAEQLRDHAPSLAVVSPRHEPVLAAVRERGVCVTTLEALGVPGTAELMAGLRPLTRELGERPSAGEHTTRPPADDVIGRRSVWQWGLSAQLLDLAEAYVGLPVRYYGADVRREHATAQAVGVRQWHRDVEDHRILKILVWLNDVDAQGGPFEYVDRAHTERLTRDLRYVSGFVSDDDLQRLAPRSDWRQATGPTWTAVVADTRNVFHRAMPPVARDRYSVTFSYTSRSPITTLPIPLPTDRQRELATRGLGERQVACLTRAFQGVS
jgi:hypothetical protein